MSEIQLGGKTIAQYNTTNSRNDILNSVFIHDATQTDDLTIALNKSAFIPGPVTLPNLTVAGNLHVIGNLNVTSTTSITGLLNIVG